jgi:predicted lipid-binding transport protein (Tim44 family)
MARFGHRHESGNWETHEGDGWEMGDGAGAPASPLDGAWTHSDQPAIASVKGDVFSSPASGPQATVDDPEAGLAAIKAKDPRFERDAFLGQVQRAFFLVEEAWTERNPTMSRQVMADGLWQQHRFQIESYRSAGKRNVLDGLSVAALTIIVVHLDQQYDTITVRILAQSADYDVNDKGKVIRGSRDQSQWAEDWTFQRAEGVATPEAGGTFADKCPNCGAPLQLDFNGVCSYCKALVSTGTYDWVLARIAKVPRAY